MLSLLPLCAGPHTAQSTAIAKCHTLHISTSFDRILLRRADTQYSCMSNQEDVLGPLEARWSLRHASMSAVRVLQLSSQSLNCSKMMKVSMVTRSHLVQVLQTWHSSMGAEKKSVADLRPVSVSLGRRRSRYQPRCLPCDHVGTYVSLLTPSPRVRQSTIHCIH